MSLWQTVGSYLERTIRLTICDKSNFGIQPNSLRNSAVLVVFTLPVRKDKNLSEFLTSLIEAGPLALAVYEQGKQIVFDGLIDVVSKSDSAALIMTKSICGEDLSMALEEFLYTTWPAEEQFDQWSTYSVICFDSEVAA